MEIERNSRLRFEFLDGLRGLAALYVALFHIVWGYGKELSPAIVHSISWLRHGGWAVDIFIVLSGYCLMLPVVRSADGRLKGGTLDYFKRRARRILPPYYAALAVTLILQMLSREGIKYLHGVRNPDWLVNFDPANLAAHLFLVHNWFPQWNHSIDFPMWSVATEWQIYFFLPALLLPVWRKAGSLVLVLVAFAVGVAPHYALSPQYNFDWAAPSLLGLFGMGMAGANLSFSMRPNVKKWRERFPWGIAGIVLALTAIFVDAFGSRLYSITIGLDAVVACATVSLIVFCARFSRHSVTTRRPLILRILEGRWAVALGAMSYSLYLMHYPAMFKIYPLMNALHMNSTAGFFFRSFVAIPLVLLFAYGFHLVFERPFLSNKAAKETLGSSHSALSAPARS